MSETPTENGFILICIEQAKSEKFIFQMALVSLNFMMVNALFPILLLISKYGRDLGEN